MFIISLRRVALLLSSLALLALPALPARAATPEGALAAATLTPLAGNSQGHTTHTITIHYAAAATPQWSYTISPAGNDAKHARVKRHDTIVWQCEGGSWKIYFKGPTPLANASGQELPEVSGAAGASAGGEVDEKVKKGDEFTYGVSVLLPGASEPVVDDPRIVIEN